MAGSNCAGSTNFWEIVDIHQKYSMLLNNEFMSDVTFIIGEEGTRVPGHTFVLIPCSWDFYNIFKLLKLDNYEFIIKDVPETSFLAFLEYCYTYTLDLSMDISEISLDKTLGILKLSQRFHIKTLELICFNHLTSNLSTMKCMNIYKHRELFPPHSLVHNTTLNYIVDCFSKKNQIQKNMDIFIDLSLEAVMKIEKKRCISSDEKEWFDILMKWAKRACEKQNLQPLGKNLRIVLGNMFNNIRFYAMTANWCLDIIANYPGLLTMKEMKRISRKINDHTVNCPGFDRVPQLLYDSPSQVVLLGTIVHFFSDTPKMDQDTADEMTSTFGVTGEKIELLGLAFVAKKNDVVNVTSCIFQFWSRGSFLQDWEIIITHPAGRYQITEDYDLITIRLEHKYMLQSSRKEYFSVDCKFDNPTKVCLPNWKVLGEFIEGITRFFFLIQE